MEVVLESISYDVTTNEQVQDLNLFGHLFPSTDVQLALSIIYTRRGFATFTVH